MAMPKRIKDCVWYTVLFSLGYLAACGGGDSQHATLILDIAKNVSRILNSQLPQSRIFPAATGAQPAVAALFQTSPPATQSDLAQSFDSRCDAYGSSAPLHQTLGNSGLLSVNFRLGNLCTTVVQSVGGDETVRPLGFPVILAGTVSHLVVYGNFASGNRFRCLDTTHTAAVADNTFIRAYYDLAHDTVFLGSGTTQLPLTCSITIPAGEDVQNITVQWVKS